MRSLRARLLASMALVTAIVAGATLLVAEPLVEERVRRESLEELEGVVAEAQEALRRGAEPRELAAALMAARAVQVAIYGPDGAPLATPEVGRHASPRELARVREVGRTSELREVGEGRRWMFLWASGEGGRVVRAARPLPPLGTVRSTLRQVMLLAGVFALLMALAMSEYLTRAIGDPIRAMTRTADAVRAGELSRRVRSRRRDELGALASAIDQMADQLVDRFEAVRREEGRLRTMLDAMVEGVLVTDAEGRIVLTNEALGRLAGGDVEGRTVIEAVRSPALHEAVQRATRGSGGTVELDLVRGTERRSISAQVAPLPKRQGVVAVLHDVTQLKLADAVRRDFVANASHELRTPLTSIRGFAETLADGALADERTARRFVGNIVENANRLQSLVDDLLELSRAESPDHPVELSPVDVGSVAAEVLRGLEGRATAKRQVLALEGAGEVALARADARALHQVLLNLADNAIKYTPEGGHVSVRVRREGTEVVLEVADDGVGIPAAHLDRVFERFYRVDKGRARAEGGTGLGLSIVRHLVQRMHGRVSVESNVGRGSTFRVVLPAV